jgi:hypothetical protein
MYKTKLFPKSMMYRVPCADDFPIKCILLREKLQYVSTQLLLSVLFYFFSILCKKERGLLKKCEILVGIKCKEFNLILTLLLSFEPVLLSTERKGFFIEMRNLVGNKIKGV